MKKIQSEVVSLLPFILAILLILFLLGKTLFPPAGKMLYGGDIYDAYFFWKNYLRQSILSRTIPFWNPYNLSGTPFLAHPNINIFYPLTWIFIIFPLNISFSLYFFIHIIIAFTTMYFLGRQYTDRWGATFAAFSFALSGYFASRIYSGHLEYVDTASWIPLAFGLTRLALKKTSGKRIILSGIGIFMLILSGNELFLLFTLEIIGLYILYLLIISYKLKNFVINFLNYLKVVVLSLVVAFGLSTVEFLPRFEFLSLSLRSLGVPYSLAVSGSSTFSILRFFIAPFLYGLPQNYNGPWPNLSEYMYYVGIAPIVLIIIYMILLVVSLSQFCLGRIKIFSLPRQQAGVPTDRGDRGTQKFSRSPQNSKFWPIPTVFKINVSNEVWFFILIIPIFIAISLGNNINPNIHELLWKFTPLYKSLRFPARHLYVVVFSLSLAGGIIFGGIKNKYIKIVILLFVVFDLLSVDRNFIQLTTYPNETFDQKLITTLQNDKDLYRVLPDYSVVSTVRRDLDFGAFSTYKIQATSDYNSMILGRYYHFIDLIDKAPYSSVPFYNVEIPPSNPWSSGINFLNIKYILSDKSADAIGKEITGKFKLVLEGERYKLYENLTYLPRFDLVGNAQIFSSDKNLEDAIRNGNPDYSNTVSILSNDRKDLSLSNLECKGGDRGEVRVLSYTPNKIILSGNIFCDSILSTSEVYYPGWEAKIDNQAVKILQSNYTFRSILITKGKHTVEFYYNPRIFYIGGLISMITIISLIYLLKSKKFN